MKSAIVLTTLTFLALVAAQCAKTTTTSPTRLAIKNTNAFTVNTVTVKSSDNSKSATFTAIGANSTSAFQEISFPALTNVAISCDTNGCNASTANLTAEKDNTLSILANSAVTDPGVTGGSGGGGW